MEQCQTSKYLALAQLDNFKYICNHVPPVLRNGKDFWENVRLEGPRYSLLKLVLVVTRAYELLRLHPSNGSARNLTTKSHKLVVRSLCATHELKHLHYPLFFWTKS